MISDTLMNWIVAAIESGGELSSLELDSHADSPVVGSEALIIRTHDRKFRVNGFTPALGYKTVDVVDAAIAYVLTQFLTLQTSNFIMTQNVFNRVHYISANQIELIGKHGRHGIFFAIIF